MEYSSDSNDSSEELKSKKDKQTKKMIKQQKRLNSFKRGTRESKRFWKEDRKRFSSLIEAPPARTSWAKKQKLRSELKHIKELSRSIIAEREEKKRLKRERRLENLKRREENARKSEVVQVIKNPAKLKKMKKKQLRNLEKRDTSTVQT